MGDAGARVVIEEFLAGEEASFIVMVDGKNVLPMATSQDHKRLLDGDKGPNTGGMGAYSPAPVVTPQLHARVLREVIQPVVHGMETEGITYTGFLYAGLMIDAQGNAKVLEFNCRMGDPETQPIMLRLKSDFAEIVEHAISGTLDQVEVEWDRRTALGVVLAAANYPDTPRKGDVITGLPAPQAKNLEDAHVFHAGTAMQDGQVVTNGGRVLCVTALGTMVKMAQKRAYEIADGIHFDGCQMRRDIGYRAIACQQEVIVPAQRIVSPHRRTPQTRRPDRLPHRILLRPGLRPGQSPRGAAPAQTQGAPAAQRTDSDCVALPAGGALPATADACEQAEAQGGRRTGDHLPDAGLHSCPRWLRGGHDTLAVRLTAHRQAALLCRSADSALVSTSANRSGQRPARTYAQCQRLFGRKVWVLPGRVGKRRNPSTIIAWADGKIMRS